PRRGTGRTSKVSLQRITHIPPATPVIAAGIPNDDNASLYRVRNLRDLGVAVKLTAMSGQIDFVFTVKGDPDPKSLHLRLSGEPDVIRRTLFY
ncbi:MAG: hypothetical protein JO022_18575, partial [Acidobacteriaceae bacterium]|nr:hypothetical protein [Acidobacteriaceae bacterium]